MPVIPATSCGICQGDPVRKQWVDKQLAANRPHTQIEAESRKLSIPVKRETLRRHVRVCVPNAVAALFVEPEPEADSIQPSAPFITLTGNDDFALLVRNEASRKLANGELRVNTGDGLTAQALIDKRVEKQKDRNLLLQLGRLLGGENATAPPVIEGEYEEVRGESLLLGSG